MKKGLKFGNEIATKLVLLQRNKMSVKLAAHVLSSSVADAIDFMRNWHDPAFEDSEGRIIERLFDLLNSRNPLAKGFEKPLRLAEKKQWIAVVDESIAYLYGLRDESGLPLMSHQILPVRTTFSSVQKRVDILLDKLEEWKLRGLILFVFRKYRFPGNNVPSNRFSFVH